MVYSNVYYSHGSYTLHPLVWCLDNAASKQVIFGAHVGDETQPPNSAILEVLWYKGVFFNIVYYFIFQLCIFSSTGYFYLCIPKYNIGIANSTSMLVS